MSISKIVQFIRNDIWRIRSAELPGPRALLIKTIRILILTLRGLTNDRWQLRASALTYYSLLSVVPALAMGFGIAKGFGFENTLQTELLKRFASQEEVVNQVVLFAHNLLENVRGGLMAGIGLVMLFWAVYRLLSQIEGAFNDIWGISQPRNLTRKITDYLAVMLICPFFLIIAGTSTVFITSEITFVVQQVSLLGAAGPLIFFLLKFLPYAVIWLLFAMLYVFLPNTKIKFRSGILAGVIAGTTFQIFQSLYIKFQIYLAGYNAIYGSFAALPLFIIWLNLSWLIVLFGAEISSSHQNVEAYEFDPDRISISHAFHNLLSLRMTHWVIKAFIRGEKDSTAVKMAAELEIPIPLANRILSNLVKADVLAEIKTDEKGSSAYLPAVDPDLITIKYVLDGLDGYGQDDLPVPSGNEMTKLTASINALGKLVEESPDNRLLRDI